MAGGRVARILDHLRGWRAAPDSDGDLLARFALARDEAAFATLVARHGPMVHGVCRRVLGNEHDVEDAFQAAFLVLARKAGSVRKRASVGAWLHQVAHHVALRARASEARRRARERQAVPVPRHEEPAADLGELRPLLDAELARLPEKYRAPLVLCYLEGRTNEEAARELGWPAGSISKRLAWGRELLRRQLTRRGVALSAAAVTVGLEGARAGAAVAASVAGATARAAIAFASGRVADEVSASASLLAEGALRVMFAHKLRGAALLLALPTGSKVVVVRWEKGSMVTLTRLSLSKWYSHSWLNTSRVCVALPSR